MRRSTTKIVRQTTSELRFLFYSRYLWILLAILAAAVAASFAGSLSHARSVHENFVDEVTRYEAQGISLGDALSQPVVVTRDNGQETIDNPLKYDFLEVGKSVRAVQGSAMISTAMDFVTFLVVPLLFLAIGAYLANFDRRSRTNLLRASRERWVWVTLGKLTTLVLVSLAVPVAVAVLALMAGLIGSAQVDQLTSVIDYPLVYPSTQTPLVLQLLTTAAIGFFFGVLGYAIGFVTRSNSWPLVLAATALFVLPFVSAWDPRNLLAVIGSQVYDFWGQFRLRPPLEMPTGTAVALLLGYLGAALVVVGVSARSARVR